MCVPCDAGIAHVFVMFQILLIHKQHNMFWINQLYINRRLLLVVVVVWCTKNCFSVCKNAYENSDSTHISLACTICHSFSNVCYSHWERKHAIANANNTIKIQHDRQRRKQKGKESEDVRIQLQITGTCSFRAYVSAICKANETVNGSNANNKRQCISISHFSSLDKFA